jgi:hypothetical protein
MYAVEAKEGSSSATAPPARCLGRGGPGALPRDSSCLAHASRTHRLLVCAFSPPHLVFLPQTLRHSCQYAAVA